jgi:hypothetical protein
MTSSGTRIFSIYHVYAYVGHGIYLHGYPIKIEIRSPAAVRPSASVPKHCDTESRCGPGPTVADSARGLFALLGKFHFGQLVPNEESAG